MNHVYYGTDIWASLNLERSTNKRNLSTQHYLKCRYGFAMFIGHHRFWIWIYTWWRHQMETFSALLALCAGNLPVNDEFPAQLPVTRSFDVFIDLHPNKRLSKHSWDWWFKMSSRSLWRHCNDSKWPKRSRDAELTSYRDGWRGNSPKKSQSRESDMVVLSMCEWLILMAFGHQGPCKPFSSCEKIYSYCIYIVLHPR